MQAQRNASSASSIIGGSAAGKAGYPRLAVRTLAAAGLCSRAAESASAGTTAGGAGSPALAGFAQPAVSTSAASPAAAGCGSGSFLQISYALLLSLQPCSHLRSALLQRLTAAAEVAAQQRVWRGRAEAAAAAGNGPAAAFAVHQAVAAEQWLAAARLPLLTVDGDALRLHMTLVLHRSYSDFATLWAAVPKRWLVAGAGASAAGAGVGCLPPLACASDDAVAITVPGAPVLSSAASVSGSISGSGSGALPQIFVPPLPERPRRVKTGSAAAAATLPAAALRHLAKEHRSLIAALHPTLLDAPTTLAAGSAAGVGSGPGSASVAGGSGAAAVIAAPSWARMDEAAEGADVMLQALNRCLLALLAAVQTEGAAQAAAARAAALSAASLNALGASSTYSAAFSSPSVAQPSVEPREYAAVRAALETFLFGGAPPLL